MKIDKVYMQLALDLAKKGTGKVEPNPLVGAVLVKNNRVIASAYHRRFGGPHAEALVLKKAQERAKGSTLYVNLEPCVDFPDKKTPECTQQIIQSGLKKVVIACRDPNRYVNSKATKLLKRNNIKVATGILKSQAARLNDYFFKYMKTGLPYVICKWAMTLDGKIATATGDSKWITSPKARNLARRLREEIQAVVVGINTVIKDNPRLTVDSGRQPVRVVLDSNGRIPLNSFLVKTANRFKTIIFARKVPTQKLKKLCQKKCILIQVRSMNLRTILKILAAMGIIKVLIEGGGNVHASAFQQHLVDEVIVFIANKIVGGENAPTPVEGKGIKKITSAIKLKNVSIKTISGSEFVLRGTIS